MRVMLNIVSKNTKVTLFFLFLVALMLVFSSKRSFACETAVQAGAAGTIPQNLMQRGFDLVASAVMSFVSDNLGVFADGIMSDVRNADRQNRNQLDGLWDAWKNNLKSMAEQLSVAQIDRNRQEGSFFDAQIQGMVARDIEKKELQAFRNFATSDKMCVVDSVAPHVLKSFEVSKAIAAAEENKIFAGDVGMGALNMQGTYSAEGREYALNRKLEILMDNYRDPNYNAGEVPMGAFSTRIGNQYNVAKTIFGKDTIDLNDADNRQDIEIFTSLALGWPVYDPIPPNAINDTSVQEKVLKRRVYQTRLNNYVGALVDPVARRSSVVASNEVEAIRQANGVLAANIAERPSYRETLKARHRQMWSPRYMKDLNEPAHVAEQKQVDMYAMKIMDLQDMIWNMERMGMIFASRLGERLDGLTKTSVGTGLDIDPR